MSIVFCVLSINQRNVPHSLSVLSCFPGCCTLPVMETVVVWEEKKGGSVEDGGDKIQTGEVWEGGHGGTSTSKREAGDGGPWGRVMDG